MHVCLAVHGVQGSRVAGPMAVGCRVWDCRLSDAILVWAWRVQVQVQLLFS